MTSLPVNGKTLGLGSAMREVPTVVWVCITVVFLGILTAFVILSSNGSSSDELTRFLNTILNFAGVILGGGGLAFGASAAVNSKRASEQTNGLLPPVVEAAAKEAIQHTMPMKEGDDVSGE